MKNFIDLEKMYSDIGNKVCKVAVVCGCIGLAELILAVVLLIGFIANTGEDGLIIGAAAFLVLGILCIIASWPLYAFGQITNDVREIKETSKMSANPKAPVYDFSDLPRL